MITYTTGDIFTSNCQALVNPVNCVGVMGKGLAKEFKSRYPENFDVYRLTCNQGKVKIGKMLVVTPVEKGGTYIINFPTKLHWMRYSQIGYITMGLIDLVKVIGMFEIKSIAVPALGCGLGGLEWGNVRPLIEYKLGGLEGVEVLVYEPEVK